MSLPRSQRFSLSAAFSTTSTNALLPGEIAQGKACNGKCFREFSMGLEKLRHSKLCKIEDFSSLLEGMSRAQRIFQVTRNDLKEYAISGYFHRENNTFIDGSVRTETTS